MIDFCGENEPDSIMENVANRLHRCYSTSVD